MRDLAPTVVGEKAVMAIPSTIGPYRILGRLGAGGMAETFLATPLGGGLPGFEPRCCIKRILPSYDTNAEFRQQFLHEAQVLPRLTHPNIVRAQDGGIDHGCPYLVMEYVEGVSLEALLQYCMTTGCRLPTDVAVRIAASTAEALYYTYFEANRLDGTLLRVVHRDVSPSNILITTQGWVKLVDFGIALHTTRPTFTMTDKVRGKVPYLSPEHINRPLGIDHRSDIFSLGAVLYEMLTLTRAFDGGDDGITIEDIKKGRLHPLRELVADVPVRLGELVDSSMMALDKHARPNGDRVAEQLAPFHHRALGSATTLARFVQATRTGESSALHSPVASSSSDVPVEVDSTGVVEVAIPNKPPIDNLEAFRALPRSVAVEYATDDSPTTARRGRRLGVAVALGIALITGGGAALLSQRSRALHVVGTPGGTGPKQASRASRTLSPRAVASTAASEIFPHTLPSGPAPARGDSLSRARSAAAETVASPPPGGPPAKAQLATLSITVRDWGYVWIDGKYYGDASQKLSATLDPGLHRIGMTSTAQGKPEKEVTIMLKPGSTRKAFDFVTASPARSTQ